jgi:hypothetical protein
VAFRPARGLDQHGEVMTYLAEFGIVLARSYLTYLAFIDATRRG